MIEDYILVIDDNKDDTEIAKQLLKRWGIANAVIIVHTTNEAVQMLDSTAFLPILILLDLSFPGDMSGVDFLKTIRANPCCKTIPVVIFTGSSDERDWLASYTAGANGFLVKPISFESWVQTILNTGLKWKITK